MRTTARLACALAVMSTSGCGLFLEGPRQARGSDTGVQADAGIDAAIRGDASMDAGGRDAARDVGLDVGLDAPTVPGDARHDAPEMFDARLDAFRSSDAHLALDAYAVPDTCAARTPEVCNGLDDDCDGPADDMIDCRTLAGVLCQRVETPRGVYLLCASTVQWDGARELCRAITDEGYSFDLVSFETNAEAVALDEALGRRSDSAWIGLRWARSGGLDAFVWASDEPLDSSETSWALNEPNNATGNEYCVEAFLSRPPTRSEGNWNDVNCENPRPMFLCERLPPP